MLILQVQRRWLHNAVSGMLLQVRNDFLSFKELSYHRLHKITREFPAARRRVRRRDYGFLSQDEKCANEIGSFVVKGVVVLSAERPDRTDSLCVEALYYLGGTEVGNDGKNGISDTVFEKNERRRHQAFSSIFFGTSL